MFLILLFLVFGGGIAFFIVVTDFGYFYFYCFCLLNNKIKAPQNSFPRHIPNSNT